jgi:hypothetical protein
MNFPKGDEPPLFGYRDRQVTISGMAYPEHELDPINGLPNHDGGDRKPLPE